MTRPRPALAGLLLVALAAAPAAAAVRAAVPDVGAGRGSAGAAVAVRGDAQYSEAYFPSSDGVSRLHADVLRPKNLPADVRTPVVLTVTPYANHNGSTSDTDQAGTGPNPRFYDFLDLTGALARGYTYVMVDLPGFGGSGGCNDWGGRREQAAVRDAVEWAAAQPWSNGRVGLLGKSYDAWTGLMGVAQQPAGLAAVVAMEPVYSGYRYLWMNGVKRSNNPQTILNFQQYDAKTGRTSDSPEYHVNSVPQGWCYGVNVAGTIADDSPTGPYWAERDLGPTARGKTTPVFLTQGFLETNTEPDGAFAYWSDLAGSQNRAWFGQFDHVRGWERTADGKRSQTGRDAFVGQLVRFLDEHLKGVAPDVADPAVEVQDARGRWRAEDRWPPADVRRLTTTLRPGSYTDSGVGSGLRPGVAQGVWSISAALPHDAWLSGEPVVTVRTTTTVPRSNLSVGLYDVDASGAARLVSRGVALLRDAGAASTSYALYGQDWPLAAGHRLAVLVSGADTDEWSPVATRQAVTVTSARVSIPFLTRDRTAFLPSDGTTPRLEQYLRAPATVLPEALLTSAATPFTLPDPLG